MSEDGMSLAFKEFGLDRIQGKLKSIEKTSNGIGRFSHMAGSMTGASSSFINSAANAAIMFQAFGEVNRVFKMMKVFSSTAQSIAKLVRLDRVTSRFSGLVSGAVDGVSKRVAPLVASTIAALAAPVTLASAGIAALAAVATAGLGIVALYFNVDKKIVKAWDNISKVASDAASWIGKQVSKSVSFWTRVVAKLAHRGDMIEKGYNLDRMKYVLDINDRKNYKDTVTQDLYAAGDSEAVDIQRKEMEKAFAENDKKLNKEIMAMAEYQSFKERE